MVIDPNLISMLHNIGAITLTSGQQTAKQRNLHKQGIRRENKQRGNKINYRILYVELEKIYGNTGWWPAETRDEIVIGTILTQNTSWKNVEKSIDQLKSIGKCSLAAISSLPMEKLSQAVRSSGFYNQKAKRLHELSKKIVSEFGGLDKMASLSDPELIDFFSSMTGVGQETLDSIMLYVFDRPHFVVDKYTLRISMRIGIELTPTLQSVKSHVMADIGNDVEALKNFHGALVYLAKDYCRKTPWCEECPVRRSCDYGMAHVTEL